MTRNFCTLFDADFLPRALALYRSLERVGGDFHLRAYAMEPGLAGLIDRLELPHLTAVDVGELESADPELAAVRSDRTWGEYCFTATPSVCQHSLQSDPALSEITYLDADLMFFADPAVLFEEIGNASVAIVPHRFSSRWAHCEASHGHYNVGFNTFRRDSAGLAALDWWRERCLEWCYLRFEPGRYGDQVYLNEFPRLFADVHVVKHPGAAVAPWNSEGRIVARQGDRIYVDGQPLIFYHFASLHLYGGEAPATLGRLASSLGWLFPALKAYRRIRGLETVVWRPFPGYRLSAAEAEIAWEPYIEELLNVLNELQGIAPGFDRGLYEASLAQLLIDTARGSLPASVRRLAARFREVHGG
jgi:hypothetical protein